MKRQDGFILVVVLGTLAALASLGAAISAMGEAAARASRVETDFLERVNLEDSSFALVAFKLLSETTPQWPRDGSPAEVEIEGLSLTASTQGIAGLINLNRAGETILATLFSREEIAALIARRPLADTAFLPAAIRPFVTIYGSHDNLDPYSIPEALLLKLPGMARRDANMLVDARRKGNELIVASIAGKYAPLLDGKASANYRIILEVPAHGGKLRFRTSAVVHVDASLRPPLRFVELGWPERLP